MDTHQSHVLTLGYVVHRTSLPSGDVSIVLSSEVEEGAPSRLLTSITVESLGASVEDIEALKARVSPLLQEGWEPHCRPGSWIGAVDGGVVGSAAIKALGHLELDEEWADFDDRADLLARTSETVSADLHRAAHEGMHLVSLGQAVTDHTTRWALDHARAL
jgi:hypothetical protein